MCPALASNANQQTHHTPNQITNKHRTSRFPFVDFPIGELIIRTATNALFSKSNLTRAALSLFVYPRVNTAMCAYPAIKTSESLFQQSRCKITTRSGSEQRPKFNWKVSKVGGRIALMLRAVKCDDPITLSRRKKAEAWLLFNFGNPKHFRKSGTEVESPLRFAASDGALDDDVWCYWFCRTIKFHLCNKLSLRVLSSDALTR